MTHFGWIVADLRAKEMDSDYHGNNMNFSYDEDLVEAPDADDYSSFWYGAASPDDVQGSFFILSKTGW